MVLIDNLDLNYIIKVPLFFSTCPMSGDISTQSPNLDKIILRNVVVVVVVVVAALEATEWEWCPSTTFDARGVSNQASQITTENL